MLAYIYIYTSSLVYNIINSTVSERSVFLQIKLSRSVEKKNKK